MTDTTARETQIADEQARQSRQDAVAAVADCPTLYATEPDGQYWEFISRDEAISAAAGTQHVGMAARDEAYLYARLAVTNDLESLPTRTITLETGDVTVIRRQAALAVAAGIPVPAERIVSMRAPRVRSAAGIQTG